jgi:GT2 family glycosyltransferase
VAVVCVLHGGFGLPGWLRQTGDRWPLDVTVNDPGDHRYGDLPPTATVTRNRAVQGFATNVNSALRRRFAEAGEDIACVVNFDVEGSTKQLSTLVKTLIAVPDLAAVGAMLRSSDGDTTFSVGVVPTPGREFVRASGLRTSSVRGLERALLRRTDRWASRNQAPASTHRVLSDGEYLPWTCLAVRADAWRQVGDLDERFPLYAEDIDWSRRCHAAGWKLAIRDCGPVVHEERATRGARADALYEYSHLELHRKWGWDRNLRWQRRGLRLHRLPPLSWLAPPLDWSLLTNLGGAGR